MIRGKKERFMWLCGPSQAGKSAIAQTIADRCYDANILIASFFFSRNNANCCDKSYLIPTIAYQLTVSIPEIRNRIWDVFRNDPLILLRSMEAQAKALIVRPLTEVALGDMDDQSSPPRLVILDGLDECKGDEIQIYIINVLSTVVKELPMPLLFLITSRPEQHIVRAFSTKNMKSLRKLLTIDHCNHFFRSSSPSMLSLDTALLQYFPQESSPDHHILDDSVHISCSPDNDINRPSLDVQIPMVPLARDPIGHDDGLSKLDLSHRFLAIPQNPVIESATLVMASVSTAHPSGSVQIPSMGSTPGSSRNYSQAPPSSQLGASTSRLISVAAHGVTSQNPLPSSRRQRASHSVVSPTSISQQQGNSNSHHGDTTPPLFDVYFHPAVVAYAAVHPRRTPPKLGPYLILQSLGEGESGKVRLGVNSQCGEEVAVKLIRLGNIDTTVRMSRVEREIEILKVLSFPFTCNGALNIYLDPQTSQHRSFIRRERDSQIRWNYSGICPGRGTLRLHPCASLLTPKGRCKALFAAHLRSLVHPPKENCTSQPQTRKFTSRSTPQRYHYRLRFHKSLRPSLG